MHTLPRKQHYTTLGGVYRFDIPLLYSFNAAHTNSLDPSDGELVTQTFS